VSKGALIGNPDSRLDGSERKENLVVSQFARGCGDDDERFDEEPPVIAEGGCSMQELALRTAYRNNSISNSPASLIHNPLQSSEGAKEKLSNEVVNESKCFLLWEVSKLCYGHYKAKNACLVVLSFTPVQIAPFLHDLYVKGVEISLAFAKLWTTALAGHPCWSVTYTQSTSITKDNSQIRQ
jgi:hypothetical protein